MSQIIQGIKNLTNGALKTFEGTTKALEGSTTLSSVGFGAASKIFKTAGKLVGGSPKKHKRVRRSKRLEGKEIKYYSPKRKSPTKKRYT
jgi:hypothetical protein